MHEFRPIHIRIGFKCKICGSTIATFYDLEINHYQFKNILNWSGSFISLHCSHLHSDEPHILLYLILDELSMLLMSIVYTLESNKNAGMQHYAIELAMFN